MDNIEQQKIEEYLTKLQYAKKDELLDEMKYLKNKHSYNIANAICYEANKVYHPNKFNPEKLNELVLSSLEKITKEYEKQMDKDLQNTFEEEKKNRNIEDTVYEVVNKIITDVNTHIRFRESLDNLNYGRGYHDVSTSRRIREIEELEVYIRQCVKNETNKLNDNVEMMYDDILLEYNKKAKNFLDNISVYKNEQSNLSQNETEFTNMTGRTLDPNGIFDDYEPENENAKRFL